MWSNPLVLLWIGIYLLFILRKFPSFYRFSVFCHTMWSNAWRSSKIPTSVRRNVIHHHRGQGHGAKVKFMETRSEHRLKLELANGKPLFSRLLVTVQVFHNKLILMLYSQLMLQILKMKCSLYWETHKWPKWLPLKTLWWKR